MRTFRIGKRTVGRDEPCYIIAEAGSNHDGDFKQALQLIDIAKDAGADAVKFQSFSAPKIAANTRHPVAQIDLAGAKTLFDLYSKLEMPPEWLPELYDYATDSDIEFLSTPFDEESVDLLDDLGIKAFKIASFELNHAPLLRRAAQKGKPLIVSTGLAYLGEVEEALSIIRSEGLNDVAFLHCTSDYPAKFKSVNLRAIDSMRAAFDIPIGYSDHTLGIDVPIAVAARGGNIIEKHYTLNKNLPGPDHAFALQPDELKAMVNGIRNVEGALGSPTKAPNPEEMPIRQRGRRSIFVKQDLDEGSLLTQENLAILRPGVGLDPGMIDLVIGRRLSRPVKAGDPLTWDDLLLDK